MHGTKIIILNWNGEGHLARFLPGVVAAAPEGVGVVVADNGSTDGAPETAAEAGRAELIYSGGNVGYGAGMNLGARHLRAAREAGEINPDYLVISNPDVVFSEDTIEELV